MEIEALFFWLLFLALVALFTLLFFLGVGGRGPSRRLYRVGRG